MSRSIRQATFLGLARRRSDDAFVVAAHLDFVRSWREPKVRKRAHAGHGPVLSDDCRCLAALLVDGRGDESRRLSHRRSVVFQLGEEGLGTSNGVGALSV